MKEMKINRMIEVENEVEEVVSLDTDSKMYYLDENLGKRCKGSIVIRGKYLSNNQLYDFNDEVFLDLLAPSEKLDGQKVEVILNQAISKINHTNIEIIIPLQIKGVLEKAKEIVDRFEELEALFNPDEMVDLCTLVKVHDDDTYASLAYRYGVEESMLRMRNQDKELCNNMLLMLP